MATVVMPWNPARMHLGARRLPNDENARGRAELCDWPGTEREIRRTKGAGRYLPLQHCVGLLHDPLPSDPLEQGDCPLAATGTDADDGAGYDRPRPELLHRLAQVPRPRCANGGATADRPNVGLVPPPTQRPATPA